MFLNNNGLCDEEELKGRIDILIDPPCMSLIACMLFVVNKAISKLCYANGI
jgi:hypothetical protein